jgi:hypothetical protein
LAPIRDTTRAEVLDLLASENPERGLPVRIFWNNAPLAELRCENGAWVIRELKLNQQRAQAGFDKATAQDRGFFPESTWAFYEPGRMVLQARSPTSLRRAVGQIAWPPRPGLHNILARGLSWF